MGLDMYLSKKTYVKNWDYMKQGERHTITVVGPHTHSINPSRVSYIIEEVMYWRKANAIHAWFVKHVQNGVDDCQESYVTSAQLIALRDLCRVVLAKTVPAEEALPPQSGFFFGSTDIDEYYWEDIAKTEKGLTALIDECNRFGWVSDFYYRSSW